MERHLAAALDPAPGPGRLPRVHRRRARDRWLGCQPWPGRPFGDPHGLQLHHEIGHAAGLVHEHQRPDRDHYVNILNVDTNGDTRIDYESLPLGPYDCSALMHYKNAGQPTDPQPKTGGCGVLSGPTLSSGDLAALHFLTPYGVWWGPVGPEPIISAPAACSWARGRIDVFARQPDNSLGQRSFEAGAWQAWKTLGTNPFSGQPSAASWGPNRIDVVVRGTDDRVYQKTWDGSAWTGYLSLGPNTVTASPMIIAPAPNRLEVVVRGTDNALWSKTYNGQAWETWRQVASNAVASEPALFAWSANELGLIVLGTDGQLYMNKKLNGQWRGYTSIEPGRAFASAPAVCSRGPGQLDLFVLGLDGRLLRRGFNQIAWGTWLAMGRRVLTSPPAAVAWGPDRLDVFIRDGDRLNWIPVEGEPRWWRRS
jgi:hypothetical protein